MCDVCMHGSRSGREVTTTTRRGVVILGLVVLAGCAHQTTMTPMPSPPWPDRVLARGPSTEIDPTTTPAPAVVNQRVLARSNWAEAAPVPARMDRMTTIHQITLHHDGMDPFYATDAKSSAARIELIRQLHRRRGWADIGYHYVIDRGGRVWEARPLIWQGAHVKDHNPGNIGIVALGNFDEQSPSQAQLETIEAFLTALKRAYTVPTQHVHTHQEWPDAATACPGVRLQDWAQGARRAGRF